MCAGQLASDTDVQFSFKIFKKKKREKKKNFIPVVLSIWTSFIDLNGVGVLQS